jgi:hypothetical protein
MYITGQASKSYEGALKLLLERGPFTRFYELVRAQACSVDWTRFAAISDIVRRQLILSPTVTGESNPRVLPAYYTLTPFEPRRENDYLRLDAVLDRLQEEVLIEIGVEPADIADLRAEHTNYLAVIQSINRSWDIDDELAVEPWFDSVKPVMNVKTLRSREPLVDVILRAEQKNHETLGVPHLRFRIRVLAGQMDTARLVASVLAESGYEKGSYELIGNGGVETVAENTRSDSNGSLVVPPPRLERLSKLWGDRRFGRLLDLGTVAPADELLGVFRFPYASSGTARCMATVTDPPNIDLRESIVFGHDELSGATSFRGVMQSAARGMRVSALAKHGFLTGMPGGGKTTLSFDILAQLAERNIPFIVLESGSKREYRALKCLEDSPDKRIRRLAKRLRVLTPGNEAICPLRFNPLQIPEGISRDEWIGIIVACFKASMAMFEPLPVLLAESLEQVYEDCAETGRIPTMVGLYQAARKTLAKKGYSGEVESNLRAALEVRLGELTCRSIGRIFACEHNIPEIDDLMTSCSVIELASLSREHGCLLALFLSTYIAARIQTQGCEGGIRLVIVIEEAHNIVGRSHDVGGGDDEHVDPKAHASEFVCRMLAEFRALGVPVLIVDQLPSAVAPEVIKNTATKMAFRQVDAEDRETLAAAMLFGPLETQEIARLTPGLGYFHTEGYHRARLIRTRNLKDELDIPSPPVGKAILPYLQDDEWFQKISAVRAAEDLNLLHKEIDALDGQCAMVTKQTRKLLTKCEQITQRPGNRVWMRPAQIADDARRLRGQLSKALATFKRGVYRTLTENDPPCPIKDKGLRRRREQLMQRFKSPLEPTIAGCLAILDSLSDGSHKIFTTLKEKANETQR